MSVVFLVESDRTLLFLLVTNLVVAKISGKPLKYTLKGLRPILCIALFAVALNIFFVSGAPISDHGILRHISREGFGIAAKMVLRLLLLVSGTSILIFTTPPLSLTDGLERLLKPLERLRVPVHEMAMMIAMAMRFIPAILEESERIFKVQSSRSADFAVSNPFRRMRGFMPVLMPLFVGTFRRGDDLATAMESRCYRGGAGRTRMRQMRFSRADLASAALMFVILAATALVETSRI